MKLRLVILLVTLFVSGQCFAGDYAHPQRKAAKQALTVMLENTVDPFLIIEVRDSGKYIQFYNVNPGLLIDLPEVALSASEVRKATEYFNKKRIRHVVKTAKNPKTFKEFEIRTWQGVFDPKEIDKVVDIAFGALFEVYGISKDTPLTFVKGWE